MFKYATDLLGKTDKNSSSLRYGGMITVLWLVIGVFSGFALTILGEVIDRYLPLGTGTILLIDDVEERHRKANALLDEAKQVAGAARIKNQETLQEVKRTQEQCREIQDALQGLSSSKNAASGDSNGQDGDEEE